MVPNIENKRPITENEMRKEERQEEEETSTQTTGADADVNEKHDFASPLEETHNAAEDSSIIDLSIEYEVRTKEGADNDMCSSIDDDLSNLTPDMQQQRQRPTMSVAAEERRNMIRHWSPSAYPTSSHRWSGAVEASILEHHQQQLQQAYSYEAQEEAPEGEHTSPVSESDVGSAFVGDDAPPPKEKQIENGDIETGGGEAVVYKNDDCDDCKLGTIGDDSSPSNQGAPDSKCQTPGDDSSPRSHPYSHQGAPDSKYQTYACIVDETQEDRSVEIHLRSMARPHMRAFHLAWISFFVAFFTWFAITPLLSEVQRSLHLSKKEVWTSSTFGVAGSAVTRILIGPFCDKFGARIAMSGTLVISAIPCALTGLVNSSTGLDVLRLIIGVAGSAFVTCQYWTSCMFTREVAGTANALVAGWGNLGGGVVQIVMGTLLFPLFKIIYGADGNMPVDRAADLSWRTICVFPAIFCFIVAYVLMKYSDDSPKGNYRKRHRQGFMQSVSARRAIGSAFRNFNTYILFFHYGCSFGVEITMVNAAALYFKDEFGQSTESAAAIASIFGWMNLFARGVGGFFSDLAYAKFGMRGRLWVQAVALVSEGIMVVIFSAAHSLAGAIVVMIVFSIFVQAAEGSTFGIVPYVNPSITGSIAGVVGAGGNIGGVVFAILFGEFEYSKSFRTMGWVVMASAALTVLLRIQGHESCWFGEEAEDVSQHRIQHVEQLGAVPPISSNGPTQSPMERSVMHGETSTRLDESMHSKSSNQSSLPSVMDEEE